MANGFLATHLVSFEIFRINVGEHNIKAASNLPSGYLGHEHLGLGRGVSSVLLYFCVETHRLH